MMYANVFSYSFCRTPNLTKDDELESQYDDPERDLGGRRFLFDRKCRSCRPGGSLSLLKPRGDSGLHFVTSSLRNGLNLWLVYTHYH